MGDLVFDVTYVTSCGHYTLRGLSSQQASWVKDGLGGRLVSITPRKLLPCALRSWNYARIATLPSAGPSPATGRGGDL